MGTRERVASALLMTRRLDTAAIFERLFQVYGAQFTLIVPAALIVFAPVALLVAIIEPNSAGAQAVTQLISLIATVWLQGMVIEAVSDIQDGRRDFTIPGLFASVMPMLGSLILVGVLAGLGILVGLVLFIVPGLVLLTWWAVVAPVVVLERRPALEAFGRSRELVRGNGWRVFGVIVVVFLIQAVLSSLLVLLFGGGDSRVGAGLGTLVSNAISAPISAIAASLVYLELRRAD